MSHLLHVVLVAWLLALPVKANAQALRTCQPPDSASALLTRVAIDIVSDTSAYGRRLRTASGVPVGTASDVTLVQDDSTCEAATAGIELAGGKHLTEAVIVVRMGQTSPFYLVTAHTQIGYRNMYVLNDLFQIVTLLGG
jgi:hypothetical protein